MLDVEFSQLSDPGVVRENNEDYLGCVIPGTPAEARSHGWFFALADGVGGQDCGEVASRTAVETVIAGFREATKEEPLTSVLPRLVKTANTRVYEAGLSAGPGGTAMATTIVACALRYDRALLAHVGDSRGYLIRQGYAVALTRDHTVPNEQLRMGIISSKEAAKARTSHLLSRSLGSDMFVGVECSEHQVFAGDVLVLCSDGLHNSVSPEDIVHAAGQGSELSAAAEELILLAKQRDGTDNISVQLIRVRGVERVGMYRGRHYKLQ